VGMCC